MYFFKPQNWRKRSGEARRRNWWCYKKKERSSPFFFLFHGAFPTRFLPPFRYNEEKTTGRWTSLEAWRACRKIERWEPLAPRAACFLLTAVLCGAQLWRLCALCPRACRRGGKRKARPAALLGGVAGAAGVPRLFPTRCARWRSRCCSTRRTTPSAKRGGIARGASCRR